MNKRTIFPLVLADTLQTLPYLTGEFEPWFDKFPLAFLETNRACPYGCTYCDWGSATLENSSYRHAHTAPMPIAGSFPPR